MSDDDWQAGHAKSFAVFLNGEALREMDDEGKPVRDDSFLLLFNAHHEALTFTLPAAAFGTGWRTLVDTAAEADAESRQLDAGGTLQVEGRAVVVLLGAVGRRSPPAAGR
jgi:isoamylase